MNAIFLNNKQFGFGKGLSTNHAIFIVTKFIYENINNDNKVLGIFIDVKKLFDSIDQNHSCHNISFSIFPDFTITYRYHLFSYVKSNKVFVNYI